MSERPWTTSRKNWLTGRSAGIVKRCCNGCGRELGDVRPDELSAAIAGRRLPDVRDECGCARMITFIRYTCDRFTAVVGPFEDRAAADEWAAGLSPGSFVNYWEPWPMPTTEQVITPRQATERAWFE